MQQLDLDLAALGRGLDGIVDHVLDHGFHEIVAGAHHHFGRDRLLEAQAAAGEAVAVGRQHASQKIGKVGRRARRIQQLRGRLIEPAGADDQVVQAVDRFLDYLERAPAARVVLGDQAAQRFERLTHDRDWSLKSMGVVLGGLAQVLGRIPERPGHAVEFLGHEGEFGHLVLRREARPPGPAHRDATGHIPEPSQAAPDGEKQTDGDDSHGEVDPRRDPHLDGLPIGPIDRGA